MDFHHKGIQWILTSSPVRNFKSAHNQSTNSNVQHRSFLWHEDDDFRSEQSKQSPYFELGALLPLALFLLLTTLIFIVIVYRRWPGLCAGIVAGCLTSISIYMLMLALRQQRLVYE